MKELGKYYCQKILKDIRNEYWIYILIMVITFLVRICPVSSGSAYADSLFNEISIGSFASTLVAFLIAWHDNHKIESEKAILNKRITESFYSSLFNYIACADYILFGETLMDLSKSQSLSYETDYYDITNNWANDLDQAVYYSVKMMQNKIRETAQKICELDISYVDNKIITLTDIDAIKEIGNCIKDDSGRLGLPSQSILYISHENLKDALSKSPEFFEKLCRMYPDYYTKYKYGEMVSCQKMFYI